MDEGGNENIHFAASTTDTGVCIVYNGNSISETYTSNPKIDNLAYSLDPRNTKVTPRYINGTGRTSKQTIFVNAWDRLVFHIYSANS